MPAMESMVLISGKPFLRASDDKILGDKGRGDG